MKGRTISPLEVNIKEYLYVFTVGKDFLSKSPKQLALKERLINSRRLILVPRIHKWLFQINKKRTNNSKERSMKISTHST